MAALVLAAAAALDALGRRKRVPVFEVHRLRAVALAAALGLSLYYPLVLLQTFNGTFMRRRVDCMRCWSRPRAGSGSSVRRGRAVGRPDRPPEPGERRPRRGPR